MSHSDLYYSYSIKLFDFFILSSADPSEANEESDIENVNPRQVLCDVSNASINRSLLIPENDL